MHPSIMINHTHCCRAQTAGLPTAPPPPLLAFTLSVCGGELDPLPLSRALEPPVMLQ